MNLIFLLLGGAIAAVLTAWIVRARLIRSLATGLRHEGGPSAETVHPDSIEHRLIRYFKDRRPVARDANVEFEERLTFGQRIADRVATFGGSWTFIFTFLGLMTLWMLLNVAEKKPFDPYPFILLNLILSCIAALQAPVIMMSQNRQNSKDRLMAKNDFEVNLKAELEIAALHLKIDELRDRKWAELVQIQADQNTTLNEILARLQKNDAQDS